MLPFPQSFLHKKKTEPVAENGILLDNQDVDWVENRVVNGLLTRENADNPVQINNEIKFVGVEKMNIRIDPNSILLEELKEGDLLVNLADELIYMVKAIHPQYEPPDMSNLWYIRCEVERSNTTAF